MSRRAPNEEAMSIANANQSFIAPEQVKADPNQAGPEPYTTQRLQFNTIGTQDSAGVFVLSLVTTDKSC